MIITELRCRTNLTLLDVGCNRFAGCNRFLVVCSSLVLAHTHSLEIHIHLVDVSRRHLMGIERRGFLEAGMWYTAVNRHRLVGHGKWVHVVQLQVRHSRCLLGLTTKRRMPVEVVEPCHPDLSPCQPCWRCRCPCSSWSVVIVLKVESLMVMKIERGNVARVE